MDKKALQAKDSDGVGVIKPLDGNQGITFSSKKFVLILIGVIILGIGSGYLLSNFGAGGLSSVKGGLSLKKSEGKGTVVGTKDLKAFPDQAEGVLRKGGIDGEGQFHLERPGGESQNVYLTSSVIDLASFVGRKVKVWGQTFDAKKAGWLMDVGRLEILE